MTFFLKFSVSKAKLSEYSEKIEALAATLAALVVCVYLVDSYLYIDILNASISAPCNSIRPQVHNI